MIIALRNDQLVYATEDLLDTSKLVCPGCYEAVYFRNGKINIPHFAHVNKNCDVNAEDESFDHIRGKLALAEYFKKFAKIELEKFIPEIKQRADILLTIGDKKIAIEYQCSPIPESKVIERSEGYKSAGIGVIWIAGPRYDKERLSKAIVSRFGHSFVVLLKKDLHGLIVKYDFKAIEFNAITPRIRVFQGAKSFIEFTQLIRQGSGNYDKSKPISEATLKRQAIKIQQNIVQLQYEWLDLQELCYLNELNVVGAPWICHPKYKLPVCLKGSAIVWRIKVILALRQYQEGKTFKSYQMYRLLYQQGKWMNLPKNHIKRYMREFLLELLNDGYLAFKDDSTFQIIKQPQWFNDVGEKLRH